MKNQNKFYFEMTDIFAGELNYCWIKRYIVSASSVLGALKKLSQYTKYHFKNTGTYYKEKNSCIALYEIKEPDKRFLELAEYL
jgi:hypothetical protein